MSSATPTVRSACVIPGASFTTNVMTAQITSITIAMMSQGSMIFIDLDLARS